MTHSTIRRLDTGRVKSTVMSGINVTHRIRAVEDPVAEVKYHKAGHR